MCQFDITIKHFINFDFISLQNINLFIRFD